MFLIVFSGGYVSEGNATKTTEIFENGRFRDGPDLPLGLADHCMIRVNVTHSILTGGLPRVSNTHVYVNVADHRCVRRFWDLSC